MHLAAAPIPRIEPHRQTLAALPAGAAGVRATLKIMRAYVKRYKVHPALRGLAMRLVEGLPQKDHRGEVRLIHAYVRDRIRYVRDVLEVETLQTPLATVELGQGDCDDKAALVATLLESIGFRSRFVAIGQRAGKFSHVYAEVRMGTAWIALETTEFWPVGRRPPGIAIKMIQE